MKKRYVLLIIICVLFVSYPAESAGITFSREDNISINEEAQESTKDLVEISTDQKLQIPTKEDIEVVKKDIGLIIQDYKFEERSRFWAAIVLISAVFGFFAKTIYYDISKTNTNFLERIVVMETIYRIKQPSNSV